MESYDPVMNTLILNLNYTCNMIPYLGYISDVAHIFTSLCSATNKFWKDNIEAISCVILKGEGAKLFLELKNNFTMKMAKYMLKYKMYLLYNFDLNIESTKAYNAIVYFLNKIEKAPDNMFETINCVVGKKSIPEFNEFITLYLEKGFISENVTVEFDDFLDEYEDIPKYE